MSLLDAPLAVLDRVLGRRPAAVRPDDAMARMVSRTTGRLRPTSAYRRRLRGHIVNQYVAVREGHAAPSARRREMGAIGRSVLYASVALAVSVTAVGAASGSSLPGDPLYVVKRQIEQVRIDIAPAWARPGLVAETLDTRLAEVESLARLGRWDRIDDAVANVETAQHALSAAGGNAGGEAVTLARHESVLGALLAQAPSRAKPGLERALAVSSAAAQATAGGASSGHGSGAAPGQNGNQGGGNGQGGGNAGGQNPGASSSSPMPTPTPKPDASAKPTKSPKATDVPAPHPTPAASPPIH